ncbi:hypothetical protein [Rhodopseudomonas palustris]|uniref:hypothetical protein n=1 Tax=Rhodopseudomonas palustris TaxID=1076 RepID=UPI0011C456CB|nr:hypothetical protein [Rhodopseudomonas palustris]
MQDDALALQGGNQSSRAVDSPIRRAVVLRSVDETPAAVCPTVKRPLQKRVWFDPPRPVVCALDEGATVECVVLGIWNSGARIRAQSPRLLTEFNLLFASGPAPVWRRCKRLVVRGDVVDVEFLPKTPR